MTDPWSLDPDFGDEPTDIERDLLVAVKADEWADRHQDEEPF